MMKLLKGLLEPKGLLPPHEPQYSIGIDTAFKELCTVEHRYITLPTGGVMYSFRISGGEWSLPMWLERKPFIQICFGDWPW
jgi:hypothetical protein